MLSIDFAHLSQDIRHLRSDLGLDESQSLGAVLVDVLLVRVGVVASAAVGIGGVAVRLEPVGLGGRALEALGTGSELFAFVSFRIVRLGELRTPWALQVPTL